MTRPHRTARKSTGGKPPRKPLPSIPLNISAPISTMPTPRVQPSTQVEQNQSTNAPKAYRPLVKDFNMEDSGFDLSKVKMEKNSQETATVAPPSYLQRRIPAPEPPRAKISLQMASNESSDSDEEEETEQEATTEKEHIEPVKEKVVDERQSQKESSSNDKPSEKPKEKLDEEKDEDKDEDKEEIPSNDDSRLEDMEGRILVSQTSVI